MTANNVPIKKVRYTSKTEGYELSLRIDEKHRLRESAIAADIVLEVGLAIATTLKDSVVVHHPCGSYTVSPEEATP